MWPIRKRATLSYLNNGTPSLWSVKRLGGIIVGLARQDGYFPVMPTNVLEYVEVGLQVSIAKLTAILVRLTLEPTSESPEIKKENLNKMEIELAIARHNDAFRIRIIEKGELTTFTCPDCHRAVT